MEKLKLLNDTLECCGYEFKVFEFSKEDLGNNYDFKASPGVYIFVETKLNLNVKGQVVYGYECTAKFLYCGKTDNLRTRFSRHHKTEELKEKNPDKLCICYTKDVKEAELLEATILKQYDTPLNNQEPQIK